MVSPAVELSVVVPVYGCAACLDELHARITATLEPRGSTYEIILVDDASRDDAAGVLTQMSAGDPRVVVVSLPLNRGQHAAIAEGLARAKGRWAAVMDCDLQDPPELLPRMLLLADHGADIVVGRRGAHSQVWWRRLATSAFGVLVRHRHGGSLVGTHSVFSVVSRRAVDSYLRRDERMVMYLPVLEALGLPIASVDYDRASRAAGQSAYGALGLARRAARMLVTRRVRRPGL